MTSDLIQLDEKLSRVRAEFPVLERDIRGKPLVYLDNGATTLKPRCVIDAVQHYYTHGTANIHRGVHLLSEEATSRYEAVRATVQSFINASKIEEIVFTTGTTAGINLVARSFVKPRLKPGDEILITALEHHANIVPWHILCEETGAKLTVAAVDDQGELDLADFERRISPRTKFISVTWTSNAIGTVIPIVPMIRAAKAARVPILVDAAQTIAHLAVDVQQLDPDFLVFSGHKLFAPTGSGVLYGKYEHLSSMPPVIGGGDMVRTVSFERTVFADPPARFEPGTPDIAAIWGLGEAIRFVTEDVGFEWIAAHEKRLTKHTWDVLSDIPGLTLIGQAKHRAPIFSFTVDAVHPHDMGTVMDQHGVAVRTGHHCAQPLLNRLGVSSTARASFSIYNTLNDVEALAYSIWRVKELFV